MERLTSYNKLKTKVQDGIGRLSSKVVITPENIAYVTYPIAEFIHQEKPDFILAFDRSARIIALATAEMHRNLYGPLPTVDHKINLRKVSRKVDREELRSQFKKDVECMLQKVDSPTILLLDEWVLTGETKKIARDIITEFSEGKIKVLFGVMRGKGKGLDREGQAADISGDRHSFANYSWRHQTDIFGVDYDSNLQPTVVRSPRTLFFRKRLINNVQSFAQRVNSNKK